LIVQFAQFGCDPSGCIDTVAPSKKAEFLTFHRDPERKEAASLVS
jgi:hypothetical protein